MKSELTFFLTVFAALAGPAIAVFFAHRMQVREKTRERQLSIFRSLMATRMTPLSPDRVKALNLVEVEFSQYPKILEKFNKLLEIYNDGLQWSSEQEIVHQRALQVVNDRTAELLKEMGLCLGFKLDNLKILRGGYYPDAFFAADQQQAEIREFLAGLNSGRKSLKMEVIDYRYPDNILENARQTQEILSQALAAEERSKDAT